MARSRSCCCLPPKETLKLQIQQREGAAPVCSVSTGSLRLKKVALSLRKTQRTESINILINVTAILKRMRFLLGISPLAVSSLLNVVMPWALITWAQQKKIIPPHKEWLKPRHKTWPLVLQILAIQISHHSGWLQLTSLWLQRCSWFKLCVSTMPRCWLVKVQAWKSSWSLQQHWPRPQALFGPLCHWQGWLAGRWAWRRWTYSQSWWRGTSGTSWLLYFARWTLRVSIGDVSKYTFLFTQCFTAHIIHAYLPQVAAPFPFGHWLIKSWLHF